MKKVSTSQGMENISTSPYLQQRLDVIPQRIEKMKIAFHDKDFKSLGEIMEEDCLDMHHVMQTQVPKTKLLE